MLEIPTELSWQAPEVSAWSIAEQIEHVFLTDAFILTQINKLDPNVLTKGRSRPNFWGWVVLLFGVRRRGVAQAPERVMPQDSSLENLRKLSADIERLLNELEPKLETVDLARWIYPHPRLGSYSTQQWLRFCEVHHQHHHLIIADIRQACQARQA